MYLIRYPKHGGSTWLMGHSEFQYEISTPLYLLHAGILQGLEPSVVMVVMDS